MGFGPDSQGEERLYCGAMGPRRIASFAALAGVVFALVQPQGSAASTSTVLASGLPAAPKVSADGQALAWSAYDPAVSGWHLMLLNNGITQMLPIAPSPTPFDVDLGDNGHGGLVAAYSRCSHPSIRTLPHGCRLYVYDFAVGAERPIAIANVAGASQFLPSMAAGRVAFVRIGEGRPAGTKNPPHIYVQSLAGGKPRLLPGGTQNNNAATGPTALDLSASSLAFTWDSHGVAGPFYPNGTSELLLDRLSGGQTLIDLQVQQEIQSIEELTPTLLGSALAYGITAAGDETYTEFRSFGLPGAVRAAAPAPEGLESTASGSSATIYSRCLPSTIVPSPASGSWRSGPHERGPLREPRPAARQQLPSEHDQRLSRQLGRVQRLRSRQAGTTGSCSVIPTAPSSPPPCRRGAFPSTCSSDPLYGGKENSLRTALAAVYSRCRTEPQLDPVDMLPLPWTGRGCVLYSYYLGATHEQPIPGAGSRYLPSVWDGELAFAREGPGGAPELYLGTLAGRRLRRLTGGPAGTGAGPRALALHEGRLAFVWEFKRGGSVHSELRLDGPGAQARLLDSTASTSGVNRELSPSFTVAGVLAWARHERGGHSWMLAYGLAGPHVGTYLVPDPLQALGTPQLSGQPQAHGTIFYARGERDGATSIMSMAYPPAVVTQR